MDIETWQLIIGIVVCLAVGIIGTIVAKNGWESKILGAWETMKSMYNSLLPTLVANNPALAAELDAMITTLEDAFADGGLTLAEFNSIVKTFKPLWNRFLEWIEDMKVSGMLSGTTTTTAN